MTLKIGVIGTGEMGQHHARIYSQNKKTDLKGIADINKERAQKLAKKYKTKAYTNHKKLLEQGLDAVSIAVPTKLHKKIALQAIEQGVHVLLEKPIADTLENADEIIKKAEEKKVKLLIGHIERFNPAVQAFKKKQDLLGKIVSISARRVGPYNPRIRDVGIITDLGVHDIDVMSYIYNEQVLSAHAYAGSITHKFEDYASILLGFNNGNAGTIQTNWLTPHKVRKLTITGTKGIAYVDYIKQKVKFFTDQGFQLIRLEKREPLSNEIEHFIDCIINDKKPMVGGREGRHALQVALAAVESYKTKKVIPL
ncbi:MAG: oxidoreductase [Candidatus Altiarchaeales archaeon ex4484_2]|nr:MAG: oxidoreductase [Candidatus Altiarchaeales archaeon ex4484_2]